MTWQNHAWNRCQTESPFSVFTDLGSQYQKECDPLPTELDRTGVMFFLLYAWQKRDWWTPKLEFDCLYKGTLKFQSFFPGEVPLEELIEIEKTHEWHLWKELADPPPSYETQPKVAVYQSHPDRVSGFSWGLGKGENLVDWIELDRIAIRKACRTIFKLSDSAISQFGAALAVKRFLRVHLKKNHGIKVDGIELYPENLFETGEDAWTSMTEQVDKEARIAAQKMESANFQLGVLHAAQSLWRDPAPRAPVTEEDPS